MTLDELRADLTRRLALSKQEYSWSHGRFLGIRLSADSPIVSIMITQRKRKSGNPIPDAWLFSYRVGNGKWSKGMSLQNLVPKVKGVLDILRIKGA